MCSSRIRKPWVRFPSRPNFLKTQLLLFLASFGMILECSSSVPIPVFSHVAVAVSVVGRANVECSKGQKTSARSSRPFMSSHCRSLLHFPSCAPLRYHSLSFTTPLRVRSLLSSFALPVMCASATWDILKHCMNAGLSMAPPVECPHAPPPN